MKRQRHSRNACRGSSLVEVLLAMLLLAVIALAAGAGLQFSQATISKNRLKRLALLQAVTRLEQLRATPYPQLEPSSPTFAWRFARLDAATNWVFSAANPGETAVIDTLTVPMTTTLRYIDLDGGSASYDALQLVVRIQAGRAANEHIELETIYAH